VRAALALQEPARLLQHLFYFIAHETTLYCGLPRIGGGQSSPINPHSGMSGGGVV